MSGLNNIYEKAFKKQKKGGWGSLRHSPPGEDTPSDTPSDAKKGRAKREYPHFGVARRQTCDRATHMFVGKSTEVVLVF